MEGVGFVEIREKVIYKKWFNQCIQYRDVITRSIMSVYPIYTLGLTLYHCILCTVRRILHSTATCNVHCTPYTVCCKYYINNTHFIFILHDVNSFFNILDVLLWWSVQCTLYTVYRMYNSC